MNCYLGIDIGTLGTKVLLVDSTGNVVAEHTSEYDLSQPHNGWAEQHPDLWWNATVEGIKAVVPAVNPQDIRGIGFSGQMHGLVMLDKNGSVIRPAILWCDTRTSAECQQITQLVGRERLLQITANPALAGFTASKIMWVKNHEPDKWTKCAKILLPKDYIRYRLCDVFATEVSDASGMQLLDIANRCWSDEVLEKLDIGKNLLADVYESVEVTGYVTDTAAQITGLCAGTPVVGGGGDNAAAAVGTGVVTDGKAFTTIGTSGVVFAHTSKMEIDAGGRVHTFCCAVPNQWHVMGVTQAAGLSLKWYRDNFCGEEIAQAEKQGIDPYILMDKEAEEVDIGCDRLVYLPYLNGERTPHLDNNARGTFAGLAVMHGKKHMIRAVMEGVSYSLKDCVEVLKQMNVPVSDMAVCGGGSKSPLWRQMLADVFGIRVKTLTSNQGAALGAAILAMVG
ncbi:MAG: xylulokinase, partial [Oscillospiraceae bacterium]|nr:xylulokinase [Oscillospiraceae bacterium]